MFNGKSCLWTRSSFLSDTYERLLSNFSEQDLDIPIGVANGYVVEFLPTMSLKSMGLIETIGVQWMRRLSSFI